MNNSQENQDKNRCRITNSITTTPTHKLKPPKEHKRNAIIKAGLPKMKK